MKSIGRYSTGIGKAHNYSHRHDEIFNCRMIGTFNIIMQDKKFDITSFKRAIKYSDCEKPKYDKTYWFIKISYEDKVFYGWAIRGVNSNQPLNILEILTKVPLPDYLKTVDLNIEVLERWENTKIKEWSSKQHWFQTFDFGTNRADSQLMWDTINTINWSEEEVLDIGCHHGYFSFKMSEQGAQVTAMDINAHSLNITKTIQDNILQQDIIVTKDIPEKDFDIILYLSVHHQPDPSYKDLKRRLDELRKKSRKYLFVELIMPPLFPKDSNMTEEQIDKIVGGEQLIRYKHVVRGYRKIYKVKGEASV